ncbi:TRAP transporter TatT component family protein [Fluviicoccus keumensis]|uniref:TRAP transporter TatT component family protein n=2 Tax=Fluviicoccus keumensis TaxID=1435465 RepID=A0A4Q7ZAK3_9GAMM|nr:TRAP transporter TatT component family protein [Fluviicoccus keumensis]
MEITKARLLESSHYTPNLITVSMNYKRFVALTRECCVAGCLLVLVGCSALVDRKVADFGAGFTAAIRDSDDPAMVEQGLPSYLLLLDALVNGSPDKPILWQAASSLNSAYVGAFIHDEARARQINEKAMKYGFKALCLRDQRLCNPRAVSPDDLNVILSSLTKKDAGVLFAAAGAWAGWIQSHADDWNAVADLSRVEMMMRRVIALDDAFEEGMPHLYLGVLATVLTPALGGRPEEGKKHFERAVELSGGKNLVAKVYYAKQYARGVFDRELHDRLLNEVLATDPHARNFTLSNMLAQAEARTLLKSADDFF